MLKRTITLVLLAMFLASARSALAQPATADPRSEATMHFGRLLVRPTFSLNNIGVDTNVFNSATDPQSDFTFTFQPAVDTWLPVARRGIFASTVSTGFVYFSQFSSERSVDPDIKTRAEVYFTRLTLFSTANFMRSRERPNFEIDARSRRFDTLFNLGARYRFTSKLSLEVSAYRKGFAFDQAAEVLGQNLRRALNRNERGFEARFGWTLTSKTSLHVAAETLRARFDFATDKNADGFRLVSGFQLSPRALIAGTAEVGFRKFSPLQPAVPDFNGLVSKVAVSSTLRSATKIGLTWDRDVAFSYDFDQPYFLTNGVSGSIRRQLVRNTDVIFTARRTLYAYRAVVSPGQPTVDGKRAVSRGFSIDLGLRPTRTTRVGLVISRSSRSTPSAVDREYRGLRVGASVTYGIQ